MKHDICSSLVIPTTARRLTAALKMDRSVDQYRT